MAKKWSPSQIAEAELIVGQFYLLLKQFVQESGYLYFDKQGREVVEAVEKWLQDRRTA